jgi:hypothetical protein
MVVEVWRQRAGGKSVAPYAAWFRGVQHCSSPWSCPACAPRLAAERGDLLSRVVERWGSERALLLTLTIRHARGHDLRRMRCAVAAAWRRVQQSRLWRGTDGEAVRALEVTYGGFAGWHPHLHVLVFLPEAPTEIATRLLRDAVYVEWRHAIERELGAEHVPDEDCGVDLRPAKDAHYIAKLGLELTAPATKAGRLRGHMTPWDIARRAAGGNAGYEALWRDWQQAMHGAKALTWPTSRRSKLRALRNAVQAEIDAEAAVEPATPEPNAPELVMTIPLSTWGAVRDELRPWILDVVRGGGDAADVQDVIDDYLAERERRRGGSWTTQQRGGP